MNIYIENGSNMHIIQKRNNNVERLRAGQALRSALHRGLVPTVLLHKHNEGSRFTRDYGMACLISDWSTQFATIDQIRYLGRGQAAWGGGEGSAVKRRAFRGQRSSLVSGD